MRGLPIALLLVGCGRIGFDIVETTGGHLAIAPRDATSNINSTIAFSATGGRLPYSFLVDAGSEPSTRPADFARGPSRAPRRSP